MLVFGLAIGLVYEIIIWYHHIMTTVSVPLTDDQHRHLTELIKQGVGANKADVLRKALEKFAEDQAVEAVLRARKEPSLEGDLDELARKLR